MSLFPAYSENSLKNSDNKDNENEGGPSWLCNSTFKTPIEKPSQQSSSKNEFASDKGEKKKKKKHKKKSLKDCSDISSSLFVEDSKPSTSRCTKAEVPQIQLTKPSSSYVRIKDKKKKRKKKSDSRRYFHVANEEKDSLLSPLNKQPLDINEFLERTKTFNICLRNNPHDIKMWLDYVKLQDSGTDSFRGSCEKKLSIIDKAIEENPGSEELLNQKMFITESIFPIDKIQIEAKSIVKKYPKCLAGWLWVVNSFQYDNADMNVMAVQGAYEEAFQGVYKAYSGTDNFLDFLFLYGLFLQQCGLWERLWVLYQLYLELNLTTAGSGEFKIDVNISDSEIDQIEDSIINSGLPLGALWLRVERLREGIHFCPPVKDSDLLDDIPDDPQRDVMPEDVNHILYPINQSCSSKLIINTLLLLKVPPLPLVDCFFRFTGLQKIPWFLENIEILLAAKYSNGETSYLDIVPDLLQGPQYLFKYPGQHEFFSFVDNVFNKCISHCKNDKVCFLIWQMRWWHWKYMFDKSNDNDLKEYRTVVSKIKKLLSSHRDCVPLFIEYALFEETAGNVSNSVNILESVINLKDPPLLAGNLYKKDLGNLYRVYIEVMARKDVESFRDKILIGLIALAFGRNFKDISIRDDLIEKSHEKYNHVTTEIIRDIVDSPVSFGDVLSPDFPVSWIICHAWFLYLTKGVWDSVTLLEQAIEEVSKKTQQTDRNMCYVILEGLHTGLLQIFSHHCNKPGNNMKLFELSERALKIFPNNAFFLNTLYSSQLSGIKWSKLSNEIFSSGSTLASALVYFMTHSRLLKEELLQTNTVMRLQSILKKLTSTYDRCPLFWKLLLQANSLKDSEEIKTTFYRSLDKCPWVKALHYEAAKLLPEALQDIEDLMVVKDLRYHVTLEEIEVLRKK